MSDTIDGLTVNYEEDGVLKSKELAKEVLTKGAWTTIMYQYQDWDQKKEAAKENGGLFGIPEAFIASRCENRQVLPSKYPTI